MIEIHHSAEERLVTIRASGELTARDYEKAIPELEEAIRKAEGALNAVLDITALRSMELGAVWKDLKFDVRHYDDFRRIAVCSRSGPQKIGARVGSILTRATVAFFDEDAGEEARRWAVAS